jgi:hypothetical protein
MEKHMIELDLFTAWMIASYDRIRGRDAERGDVPGWVMVTIMTAGLVVLVFTAFKLQISSAITNAIKKVTDNT